MTSGGRFFFRQQLIVVMHCQQGACDRKHGLYGNGIWITNGAQEQFSVVCNLLLQFKEPTLVGKG